ncbi:NERD domain-containing protein [Arthrobacter zhaoguopingii]|uniref:NERD domain-containing protein n=1 Tax=Arthrobacter zhaoguopingii TaxID=2681491 RepID=UPI001FEE21D3|nr:NERD domain-containing protein [Arthrobacter zhaoguopingii]
MNERNHLYCIPQEPEFSESQWAERAVWEVLRSSLPDDVVLAHSVHIRDGNAEHEIDILVLWPGVGLAAIEVKGGLVTVENGQWYQSGGTSGRHRLKEGPLAQSQGSMHAFRNWISDELGTPLRSRFAYMACLPYTSLPQGWVMSGCPRPLFLDQGDLKSPADKIRRAIETQGSGATPLAPAYLERIARRLEGTLEAPLNPETNPQELEDRQDQLTVRQAVLLSATRDIPRIRFTGGAGSGKTWLALAKARSLCREGQRVGLFCYNKGLAQHLQNRVSSWRHAKPAFTGEFHDYVRSLGVPDGDGQAYFDEEVPQHLRDKAAELPFEQKFDAIIIDEAQDFAPLWWEALTACLKDQSKGQIYAFMDDRQDVYRRWGGVTNDFIHGPAADLVPIHIDENLRNTRRIAETFKSFAGEHFTPRGEAGLPVRRVECSTEDALEVAGDCIEALLDEGWANNQIALLTTHHRHPIHLDYFERKATQEYWSNFHADESEFYGHVLGFKGLERSVIILCVDGFKELDRAPEQLYVGLSRARSLLVVVGDSALLREAGGPELARVLSSAQQWKPMVP